MPSKLEEIERTTAQARGKVERKERTQIIRDLVPNERVLKPRGSKKVINQCRILNIGPFTRSTSKSSPHRRCKFSGKQQLLTANPDEPWVWACLKHVRYFLDTLGQITLRNDPEGEPRVLRA